MYNLHNDFTLSNRDARPYQPGNVLSSHRGSFYHQNRQDSNRRGGRTGGGRMHGGDNTQDHSSGAPSSGWKGTLADKQGEFFFANRDSRNRDNRGYGNHSGRGKWHTNWASNDREPRPSTSGVKPSTPRTFTRNPPPPTPQSQVCWWVNVSEGWCWFGVSYEFKRMFVWCQLFHINGK